MNYKKGEDQERRSINGEKETEKSPNNGISKDYGNENRKRNISDITKRRPKPLLENVNFLARRFFDRRKKNKYTFKMERKQNTQRIRNLLAYIYFKNLLKNIMSKLEIILLARMVHKWVVSKSPRNLLIYFEDHH